MTATLYPTRRTDRLTSPSVGRTHRTPCRAQPDYRARRVVAASAVAALLGLTLVTAGVVAPALVDVGGRPAAASGITDLTSVLSPRTHVAQSGDTLWSIAESYRGDVGRDRYVDALIDLNGGTVIQIGQAVRLP